MALVVFLKGVNVGGHKTFRPSVLAKDLQLDAVSIGAAGTFVIRNPVSRTKLRAEVARRLPFEADVMMCQGSEILQLASADPFAGQPSGPTDPAIRRCDGQADTVSTAGACRHPVGS